MFFEAVDLFAFKEIQDCLRGRLSDRSLHTLFSRVVNVRLNVHWHQPFGRSEDRTDPQRQKSFGRGTGKASVHDCDGSSGNSKPAGKPRLQLSVNVRGQTLLTLVGSAERVSQAAEVEQAHGSRLSEEKREDSCGTELLDLLAHDLEATVENHLLKSELRSLRQLLATLEAEQARLRRELCKRFPDLTSPGERRPAGTHAQQIVQEMIAWIGRNYRRPISLQELAAVLKMNASYISSVFSRTTGTTFHKCLDELRLTRAKELLADPARRISDVARATGYASGDYFRQAFRAHTGISPSDWRKTR